MNKAEIHKAFIEKLAVQVAAITLASKHAMSDVTDPEHKARSKYETFSLEASYLARGQSLRVEEMRDALSILRAMPVSPLPHGEKIQLGAWVVLMDHLGEEQQLYITPLGCGLSVDTPEGPVAMITPASPLGRALMGKSAGDAVNLGNATEPYSILIVA